MICTAVSTELFKCRNQLWFRAFQHLQHSFKTFFFFFSHSLHRENSKNKKSHSLPISFAMRLIFSHYRQISLENFHHPTSEKMININRSIDCLLIYFWFLYAFIILKDKREKSRKKDFIQYLSIYFISILKRAFDVYCPLPVILA